MTGKARCSRLLSEQAGNDNAPVARPSGETYGTALAVIHRNLLDVKMDLAKVVQESVRGSKPNNPFGYVKMPRANERGRASSCPCNLPKELRLPDFSQTVI